MLCQQFFSVIRKVLTKLNPIKNYLSFPEKFTRFKTNFYFPLNIKETFFKQSYTIFHNLVFLLIFLAISSAFPT